MFVHGGIVRFCLRLIILYNALIRALTVYSVHTFLGLKGSNEGIGDVETRRKTLGVAKVRQNNKLVSFWAKSAIQIPFQITVTCTLLH